MKKTILLFILCLAALISLPALGEDDVLPGVFSAEGDVFFGGITFGMSEEQVLSKSGGTFLGREELNHGSSVKIRYDSIFGLAKTTVDFRFYKNKLHNVTLDLSFSDAQTTAGNFRLVNKILRQALGEPDAYETIEKLFSNFDGKIIPPESMYNYVWHTPSGCEIGMDGVAASGPEGFTVTFACQDGSLFEHVDLSAIFMSGAETGSLLPRGDEPLLGGIEYGMSRNEVFARETGEWLPSGQSVLENREDVDVYQHSRLFGLVDVRVEYEFISGELKDVTYVFPIKDYSRSLMEYDYLNYALVATYAPPLQYDQTINSGGAKKIGRISPGLIQSGDVTLTWFSYFGHQAVLHKLGVDSFSNPETPLHYIQIHPRKPDIPAGKASSAVYGDREGESLPTASDTDLVLRFAHGLTMCGIDTEDVSFAFSTESYKYGTYDLCVYVANDNVTLEIAYNSGIVCWYSVTIQVKEDEADAFRLLDALIIFLHIYEGIDGSVAFDLLNDMGNRLEEMDGYQMSEQKINNDSVYMMQFDSSVVISIMPGLH